MRLTQNKRTQYCGMVMLPQKVALCYSWLHDFKLGNNIYIYVYTLFFINVSFSRFSGLKPIFPQNVLFLVAAFLLKLLMLHLIKHVSLGFTIYHLRL